MTPKWVLYSWQIWTGLLAILFGLGIIVLNHLHPGIIPNEISSQATILVFAGISALILRLKTTQPITFRKAP